MSHANGRPEDNTVGACCLETRFNSVMVHEWRGGRAVDCANLENWKTQKWVSGVRIPPSPQIHKTMSEYKYRRVRVSFEYTEVVYEESDAKAQALVLDGLIDDMACLADKFRFNVEVIGKEEAQKTAGHDDEWFPWVEDMALEREKNEERKKLAKKEQQKRVSIQVGSRIHELKRTGE